MGVKKWNSIGYGVKLQMEEANLFLIPKTEKMVQVVYTLGECISQVKSLSVTYDAVFKDWSAKEEEHNVVLITNSLHVKVNKTSGSISFYDTKGNLIMEEANKNSKLLQPVDLVKTKFDMNEKMDMEVTVDGLRVKNNNTKTYVDRISYHGKVSFKWKKEEALYGLGSHEEGIMNLKGTHQYLYQQNMKAVVPVLMSNKGYGIFFDNYSFMTFYDDMYGSYMWMEYAPEINYYFMYGPEYKTVIQQYRILTGTAPMLPKWAFAYVQSKEKYSSSEELIEIASQYRQRNIPLDCIVLDWCSWTGNLWGEKLMDQSRFPNPKELTNTLHNMNVKMMISIWPNMAPGGSNHKEMQEKGLLLGNQSTYNAFSKEGRELYWKHADAGLFQHGVDAWWCDCTEPFEGDWKGLIKPEPEERIAVNCEEARKYLDSEYINAFSLEHSKGIYEGQRSTCTDKRVINLTRSAYAGQHRYGTITWSGDTSASWQTLKNQIPAGLNFVVTGEPYWTMDIGAFFVKQKEQWFWDGEYEKGNEDNGYKELYLRWFQYGTFLPMFRSHGTDTAREVWRFGEAGDIFYDTQIKFINLRYKLMPYIYSLAGAITVDYGTMMKPLGMDFPDDENTYDIKNEYMFGPSILVCPITEPFYYDADSVVRNKENKVSIYLPKGCDWYDYWTNEKHAGGQWVMKEVPLDIIPLYIKAGSIIPMGTKIIQHTGEDDYSDLNIVVYPGADGEFVLYEDSGDGYDYEKGVYGLTSLIWNEKTGKLTIADTVGSYSLLKERTYHITVME